MPGDGGDGGAGPKAGEGCCPIAGSSMFMLECRQLAVTKGAVERDACKRSGELRTRDESRLLSGNGKRIGEDL
jgi:hypothetical protein